MARVVDVTIESHVDEVLEVLKTEKIKAWLQAVGEDAAATATSIPNFPVDTARMKNSINWAIQGKHGAGGDTPLAEPEEKTVYIGTNVEYAPYHEFGTSRGIPARHFLQFGMTAHQNEYKEQLEEILKQ